MVVTKGLVGLWRVGDLRRVKASSAREREIVGLPSSALERKFWRLWDRGTDDMVGRKRGEVRSEWHLRKEGRVGVRQKDSDMVLDGRSGGSPG